MRDVGHDPRGLDRLRRRPRHPDHGDQGEAVLDRRQPLGPRHRVRRDGGPVGRAARGRVGADQADGRPSRARSPSASSRACPCRVDGEALRAARADRASSNDLVGAYGWGRLDMVENRRVGIKSRETYECPAGAGADHGPRATSSRSRLERDLAAREDRGSSTATPSSSTTACGSARSRRRSTRSSTRASGSSPARCACASSRAVLRRRPSQRRTASTTTAWPPTTPPTRFRHEDSEGFVRLWGLGVQTWAASRARADAR